MEKQTICISENKGTDQLRSTYKADQHLCLCYTDSTIALLYKSNKNSAEVDIAPASGKIHITMQGFTLTAITDAEKTKLRLKN